MVFQNNSCVVEFHNSGLSNNSYFGFILDGETVAEAFYFLGRPTQSVDPNLLSRVAVSQCLWYSGHWNDVHEKQTNQSHQ